MSNLGSGRKLHSQTREVVFKVYSYLKAIADKELDITNSCTTDLKKHLSTATGVSVKSIYNILKEAELNIEKSDDEDYQEPEKAVFNSPKRKRLRKKPVTDSDDITSYDLRQVIYNFHKTNNQRITLNSLLQKLKDDFQFSGSKTSLRRMLKTLGFRWRVTQNNRKLLQEKSDIRGLRIKYLEKLKLYRQQNRTIIYMDETYLHGSHTKSHSWSDKTTNGLLSTISKGKRLIMLHAGGENIGFVKNALLIFKSGTKTGDYHNEMNFENYEKWLKEKLIPNLPKNSVLVLDNAPHRIITYK